MATQDFTLSASAWTPLGPTPLALSVLSNMAVLYRQDTAAPVLGADYTPLERKDGARALRAPGYTVYARALAGTAMVSVDPEPAASGGGASSGTVPLAYAAASGSPFTLSASWQKVATTTAATKGLRIAPVASAQTFDIEWVAVPAGAAAPTDAYGEPVQGGESFPAGLPIGDVYLKSASGQVAVVRVGN